MLPNLIFRIRFVKEDSVADFTEMNGKFCSEKKLFPISKNQSEYAFSPILEDIFHSNYVISFLVGALNEKSYHLLQWLLFFHGSKLLQGGSQIRLNTLFVMFRVLSPVSFFVEEQKSS